MTQTDKLIRDIESGDLLREYQHLPRSRKEQIRSLLKRLLREIGKVDLPPRFGFRISTERLLNVSRRGWRVDPSLIDKTRLPRDWQGKIGDYEKYLDKYGDDSLAHLCLPSRECLALQRCRVNTISRLEQIVSEGGLTKLTPDIRPGIGVSGELIIIAALEELRLLKQQYPDPPSS